METLKSVLFWLSAMNFGLLLFWLGLLLFYRDWLYALHSSLFRITKEEFALVHYACMALYDVAIMMFNVFPYIALRIVDG